MASPHEVRIVLSWHDRAMTSRTPPAPISVAPPGHEAQLEHLSPGKLFRFVLTHKATLPVWWKCHTQLSKLLTGAVGVAVPFRVFRTLCVGQ